MTKSTQTGFPATGKTGDRLRASATRLTALPLSDVISGEGRFKACSASACGLLMDYSRQRVDEDVMAALFDFAAERELAGWRERLFSGEKVNTTENRAALHMALRSQPGERFEVDGEDVAAAVNSELAKMSDFVDAVHSGELTGATGKKIRHVVNIGIGGSDLGIAMAWQALRDFRHDGITCHFASAIDGQALRDLCAALDPGEVLFVVCSKSFSTQETKANADRARAWLADALGDEAITRQFVAISTNHKAMDAFGIAPDHRFTIWDWVGGRYSVWSAVGMTLALGIGMNRFRELLAGANDMDRHFRTADAGENLPLLTALLDVWNINWLGSHSLVVLPYTERLGRLPAYLQQLIMESLGKRVTRDGEPLTYRTGTMIWGGPGSDGQHAFMQLLHQGTETFSAEFIVPAELPEGDADLNRMNQANAVAQANTLMLGRAVPGEPWRDQPGGHPSTVIVTDTLTPRLLGSLVAFFEHRVFCCATLWGINPFDQWGVELGKLIAAELLQSTGGDGLIGYLRERRNDR